MFWKKFKIKKILCRNTLFKLESMFYSDPRVTNPTMKKSLLRVFKVQFLQFFLKKQSINGSDLFTMSFVRDSHNSFPCKDARYIDTSLKITHFLVFLSVLVRVLFIKRLSSNFKSSYCLAIYYYMSLVSQAKSSTVEIIGFGFLKEIALACELLRVSGKYIIYNDPRTIISNNSIIFFDSVRPLNFLSSAYYISLKKYKKINVKNSLIKHTLPEHDFDLGKSPIIFFSSGMYSRIGEGTYIDKYLLASANIENEVVSMCSDYCKNNNVELIISPHYFRGVESFCDAHNHFMRLTSGYANILKPDCTPPLGLGVTYSSNIIGDLLVNGYPCVVIEGMHDQQDFFTELNLENIFFSKKEVIDVFLSNVRNLSNTQFFDKVHKSDILRANA
jgi:hypothetical protein